LLPIKRIDHVAIAAESIDERVRFLSELFGMKPGPRYDNPQDGYNGVELTIPGSDTKWEVIEPAGENSFVTRFLGQRGPGLHHVTFEVTDIEAAAKVLRERGIEPVGMRVEGAWNKELFIHPRDTGGVLIQLYEEG
jgi:methylmalonyl-CoA/ethylmalonyl-CoA epimerase